MIEIDVEMFEVKDYERDSMPSVKIWSKPDCSETFFEEFRNWGSEFLLESDEICLYFKGISKIDDIYMDEEMVSIKIFSNGYPEWFKSKDEFLKFKI